MEKEVHDYNNSMTSALFPSSLTIKRDKWNSWATCL